MNMHRMPRWALALIVAAAVVPMAAVPVSAADPLPESSGHLTGIDVSHWQGTIGWATVKRAGVKFAFAKATEGQTFIDGQYQRNRNKADAVGLRFGAYHYAQPDLGRKDAVREADHFMRTAGLEGRHLLPVLDLEVHNGLSREDLVAWTKNWLQRVESQLGVKPMIYTSPSFWQERMGDTRWFAKNGYRALWIAHWRVPEPSTPANNWVGHGWTFWQVSNCGKVAGIGGCVDVNLYRNLNIRELIIKKHR